MVEWKDVHSTSPAKTPKLQFTAEQLLTGECWILPKKRYSMSKGKGEDGRRGEIVLEANCIPTRDSRGLKQTLCAPGPRDPTETEPELCLSVSCRGTGQPQTDAGTEVLSAVDLGMA